MHPPRNWLKSARKIAADITEGFLEITHNSFALIGILVAMIMLGFFAHPEIRSRGEAQLRAWLQEPSEQVAQVTPEMDATEGSSNVGFKDLPKDQASVAHWISKKYRVAQEPIAAIVSEAYELGTKQKIDPTLILAVMAVESSFNPYAQSSVGAQGLMQVMTRVHTEKYESFGGDHAAFDPVSNLHVGTAILKEYIQLTGSVEGGLKYYVGAANLDSDGGYSAKVLAEHRRLRSIAGAATPKTFIKSALVAKRQITPIVDEESEAVAASNVTDNNTQVVASSNL